MKRILLLSLIFSLSLFFKVQAQDRTVSGRVTSAEDGTALPGVNVAIKGSTVGTSTDANGAYNLSVPANTTLVFSFIGLASQEVAVGNRTVIDIQMLPDVKQLNEVVVTGALGISREKASLGYATTQISNAELLQGQNTNPISALQGKVAGLNINTGSNGPGNASRIVLRGPTSFTGNNQPLFVIDGIISSNSNYRNTGTDGTEQSLDNQVDYGNRGADINPQDIETITVLKGPAAAALYGSVASNGAIVITTKKGQAGKMNVTFNSNITFSNILKLPDFQNEFGQGNIYSGVDDDRRENYSWGYPFDGKLRPWGQEINGKQKVKPYSALPNNVKDFFETGKTLNNTLSISGGNEKSTYFLSLTSQNNTGVIPTTSYKKYGVRFNGTSEISKKFSSGISINYTNVDSDPANGGQGDAFYNQIIQTPRDISIVDQKNLSDPFNGFLTGEDGTNYYGYYGGYTKNPYFLLNANKNNNKVDRITGNFTLSYKPIEGLNITERLGGDIFSDRRYQRFAKYNYVPLDPFYDPIISLSTANGRYSEDIYNYTQLNNDLIATYNGKISSDFTFKLLAGNNVRKTTLNNTYGATNQTEGLVVPGLYNLSSSFGNFDAANSLNETFLVGAYGEIDLAYKDILFLGATGRNDWSSTLPVSNRSFFYPSVNASFVFSHLLGDAIQNVMSFGKIRASWAKVGNDASAYQTTSVYPKQTLVGDFGSVTFPFNGVPGFTKGDRIGNSQLSPEFTTSSEVGLEIGFFRNRLTLDATYYLNKSTDLILNVPLAPSTGFGVRTSNVGEMQNKGIEIALRGTPIQTASGLKVEMYATFTKVKNMVKSIIPGVDNISVNSAGSGFSGLDIVATPGRPYGTFYGTTPLIDTITGKTVVSATTGIPVIATKNQYLGSYLPKYQASLGGNVIYKGFSLSVLFDMKQGGRVYSRTRNTMAFVGTSPESTVNGRKDFVFPNSVIQNENGPGYIENTSVTFSPYNFFTNQFGNIAEYSMVDASYIKFREASINYSLPKQLLTKTPFSGVTVGVFGNNLFIWTPKENKFIDPEINSQGASNVQGFEFGATPSLRNYGFSLRLSL